MELFNHWLDLIVEERRAKNCVMNIAQIESEALSLPVDARASLAHRLLLSLEEISEPEFDRLWGEESARRAAEVDAGLAQAVPGDEVARKVRALLR